MSAEPNGRRPAAVCFDLDGTLVSERVGVRDARLAVGLALRERQLTVIDPDGFANAVEQVVADTLAENGGQWPTWFHVEQWLTLALQRIDCPQAVENLDTLRQLGDIYKSERIARARAIPGAQDAIDAARRRGPVALITNFGEGDLQRRKIAAAGLDGQFDAVVISGEIDCWKPNPEIFHHAAAQLGLPVADCVHIGNSIESDIDGALAAGMSALLVEEDDRPRPADLDPRALWRPNLPQVAAWLNDANS